MLFVLKNLYGENRQIWMTQMVLARQCHTVDAKLGEEGELSLVSSLGFLRLLPVATTFMTLAHQCDSIYK